MERTAQQARENWADLINTVQFGGQTVTITKHGKPAAMVQPYRDYAVNVDSLDVIEVADNNNDYDPAEIGRFAVQQDGECLATLDTAEAAEIYLAGLTGRVVKLVPAVNYFNGRRWIVEGKGRGRNAT